ncbi:Uncharacterised protein [uncultured archaeon]|nr:Uncharacterised protein [uncultured archaeon]
MGSTYERSFVKGMVWEFISFLLVTVAVYIVYGNLSTSVQFSAIFTLIKIPLFFVHERLWKHIGWGKIRDKR